MLLNNLFWMVFHDSDIELILFLIIKFYKQIDTTNLFNKQIILKSRNSDLFNKYVELVLTTHKSI